MSSSFKSLDIRECIEIIGRSFPVSVVKSEISPRFELASIVSKYDKSSDILLFPRLKDYNKYVGISNIVNTREKIRSILNVSSDVELYRKILYAETKASDSISFDTVSSPDRYKILEDFDLRELPFALFYELESRPYITSGVIAIKDRSGFINLSIHRISIIDRDKLVVRIVPRHLFALWRRFCSEGSEGAPVAIYLGVSPIVHIAAASSPPFGTSELCMIYYLSGVRPRVYFDEKYDVPVLLDADIVLVGEISCRERSVEGPYVDVLGLYDDARFEPVLKVSRVYLRSDVNRYFMYYIVPALSEHRLLMSIEKEAKIWSYVSNVVPEVTAVRLTPGGGSWLHAVIAIRKQTDGDPKNAILAAFAAHPSLKHVVVVDSDIDVDDPEKVEWAIATRFRGDKDLIVIKYVRGSTLDPSSIDQATGLTVKIGIDATAPISSRAKFEHARLVPIASEKINIRKISLERSSKLFELLEGSE